MCAPPDAFAYRVSGSCTGSSSGGGQSPATRSLVSPPAATEECRFVTEATSRPNELESLSHPPLIRPCRRVSPPSCIRRATRALSVRAVGGAVGAGPHREGDGHHGRHRHRRDLDRPLRKRAQRTPRRTDKGNHHRNHPGARARRGRGHLVGSFCASTSHMAVTSVSDPVVPTGRVWSAKNLETGEFRCRPGVVKPFPPIVAVPSRKRCQPPRRLKLTLAGVVKRQGSPTYGLDAIASP